MMSLNKDKIDKFITKNFESCCSDSEVGTFQKDKEGRYKLELLNTSFLIYEKGCRDTLCELIAMGILKLDTGDL